MADIKQIIDELLKEPIASVLGDSGGAYGYQFEKNQQNGYLTGLNPVDEYTDGSERTLEVIIPVYDFLTYNLVKDEITIGLEKQLMQELEENDINKYHIFEVADFLNSGCFTGMHIQNKVEYVNTYNYEEYLSQTLLYAVLSNGYDNYVILEVHNGCDVRSGYTKPQLFKIKDLDYWYIGQYERCTVCDCGLNDYKLVGYDEIYESACGDMIDKELVYDRTYVDDDANVKCRDCDSVIEGGFIKW